MTTRLSQSRSARRGFTLVELLVVIAIIGILVGMLAVAIIPALQRGKEAAIQIEMKQIEQSIEQFRTDKGFYPPSFEGLTLAQFRSFVNRMAPNNRETSDGRLGPWWDAIGEQLDRESSLVFWLSGTFENQQYPITGGPNAGAVAGVAAHNFGADVGQRKVYFDFQTGQLVGDDSDETVGNSSGAAVSTAPGIILEYRQEHGKSSGDLLFKYLDSTSYDMGAYFDIGSNDYINPKTFQLITFGLDGERGAPPAPIGGTGGAMALGICANDSDLSADGEDNLCHFANGRIRLWLIANGQ